MNRLLLACAILALAPVTLADRKTDTSNTLTKTKTFEIKLESSPGICQATASLDYFQRGNEAQVETSVHTEECGAAEGNFVVSLTVRGDGDDEPRVLNFEETWERSDDIPVESMQRYPIGDDVDLLRVKTRKLSCKCTSAAGDMTE